MLYTHLAKASCAILVNTTPATDQHNALGGLGVDDPVRYTSYSVHCNFGTVLFRYMSCHTFLESFFFTRIICLGDRMCLF